MKLRMLDSEGGAIKDAKCDLHSFQMVEGEACCAAWFEGSPIEDTRARVPREADLCQRLQRQPLLYLRLDCAEG